MKSYSITNDNGHRLELTVSGNITAETQDINIKVTGLHIDERGLRTLFDEIGEMVCDSDRRFTKVATVPTPEQDAHPLPDHKGRPERRRWADTQ